MGTVKQIYATLGRLAYASIKPALKVYMTPKHHRVRVLLLNDQNEALLVRNWLGHQRWTLPGGGIRRPETPREAAIREVEEETGIVLSSLDQLGTFTNPFPESRYTVACFMAMISKKQPLIARYRRLEVLDVGWFPLNGLPNNYSPTIDLALALRK
jgi:ADP-ribose pyrophosphatase YjhB (NUDIX family)